MYWIVLNIEQNQIYVEIQNSIKNKKLKADYVLKIKTSEIESSIAWKNKHEFYKDGYICDVISHETEADFTILKYIRDKKETEIEKKIAELYHPIKTKKNSSKDFKIKIPILDFWSLSIFRFNTTSYAVSYVSLFDNHYQSINISPGTPPPNFV
ncbi:MAG: hypothetical protein JXR60_06485 [Bacteroidales bacterium]|nr:hypothetical protein [Bacteroidales bacterium]